MRLKFLMGALCVWAGMDMVREAIQLEIASQDWKEYIRRWADDE